MTKSDLSPRVRKAVPADWQRIRDICCRTGSAGDPIATERWPFFGEQWIGPYQRLLPDWSYVAEQDRKVLAYLTGCPETGAFLLKRKFRHDFPLFARVAFGAYPKNSDTKRFLRRTLHLDTSPEERFSRATWELLLKKYPAHLHINADANYRGRGVGRLLIDQFVADLRPLGCPGVHVFCGAKPVPFYERLGFRELEKIEFVPGLWVFSLGLSI